MTGSIDMARINPAAVSCTALALWLVVTATPQHRLRQATTGSIPHRRTPRRLSSRRLILGWLAAGAVVSVWCVGPGVTVAGVMAAATITRIAGAALRRRRQQAVDRAVADSVAVAAANLSAGRGIAAAMQAAATHAATTAPPAPQPVVSAVAAAARAAALGRDGAAELVAAGEQSPQLAAVGRLWRLAVTRGIAVADLLSTQVDNLQAAARHRAKVQAALAGPKTSAGVLAGLPVAGIGLGELLGGNPVGYLTGGGFGTVCLVGGTALLCAGTLSAHALFNRAEKGV